jgi:hypothetical protein
MRRVHVIRGAIVPRDCCSEYARKCGAFVGYDESADMVRVFFRGAHGVAFVTAACPTFEWFGTSPRYVVFREVSR